MAVKGTGQVVELDQVGELARFRGIDLAGILAELGRDLGQTQRREELGLGPAGDRPVRRPSGHIRSSESPRASARLRIAMLWAFEPGEVMEGERELAVLDAPQVALDAVGQPDARLGRPVRQHRRHLGQLDEGVEHRGGLLRAEQDVEIADRLGPATEAAAKLGPDHLGMVAHRLQDRSDQPQGVALEDPLARLLDEGDPFEDLRLGLLPEPLELGDLARLARLAQIGQALDLQVSWSALIFLGPRPGMRNRATRPGGVLRRSSS